MKNVDIKKVVQALVQDLKLFKKIEGSNYPLKSQQIEDKVDKKMFQIAEKYFRKGNNKVTKEMLKNEGIKAEIVDVVFDTYTKDSDVVENFSLHFEKVQVQNYIAHQKEVFDEVEKLKENLLNVLSNDEVAKIHDKIILLMDSVKHPKTLNTKTNLKEIFEGYSVFEDQSKIGFISTSIQMLDGAIGGGFERGGVSVVAGPPGSGKSTVAISMIVDAIKKGLKVLFISTEMRELDILHKMLSHESNIDFSFWRKENQKTNEELQKRVQKAMKEESTRQIIESENLLLEFSSYDEKGLLARLQKAYEVEGVDIVIVDYLQRMKATMTAKDSLGSYESMIENSTDYIKTTKMSLLWLSQLTKDGPIKNKEGFAKMSEIRFAPRLHHDAFVDIRIWRDETDEEGKQGEKKDPTIHFFVKKTRFGSGLDKKFTFHFHGGLSKIGKILVDDSQQETEKKVQEKRGNGNNKKVKNPTTPTERNMMFGVDEEKEFAPIDFDDERFANDLFGGMM